MTQITPRRRFISFWQTYQPYCAPFFFGRDVQREIITANLIASRLTLLYGKTGVGKSSVLQAGVEYHLRGLARRNLAEYGTPEFAVVVFSSWRDDPIVALKDRVRDSVAQTFNGHLFEPIPQSHSLSQTLQIWTERMNGDLLIIMDQFEEYFLYHKDEDGEGTFAVEFPRAVNRTDLRVNFLVSIREDALARVDRFKGKIPDLFGSYLRLEHLDAAAAREAIEKPVEKYNSLQRTEKEKVSIEPNLVDKVLEEVRTDWVDDGDGARGVTNFSSAPAQAPIETPYLQLLMTHLWKEEMDAGSCILRLDTLNRLGGVKQIVRTHLDAVMKC